MWRFLALIGNNLKIIRGKWAGIVKMDIHFKHVALDKTPFFEFKCMFSANLKLRF